MYSHRCKPPCPPHPSLANLLPPMLTSPSHPAGLCYSAHPECLKRGDSICWETSGEQAAGILVEPEMLSWPLHTQSMFEFIFTFKSCMVLQLVITAGAYNTGTDFMHTASGMHIAYGMYMAYGMHRAALSQTCSREIYLSY